MDNEQHDIEQLNSIAENFKILKFPEAKTARGQQIVARAKAQLDLISKKIIQATKTI